MKAIAEIGGEDISDNKGKKCIKIDKLNKENKERYKDNSVFCVPKLKKFSFLCDVCTKKCWALLFMPVHSIKNNIVKTKNGRSFVGHYFVLSFSEKICFKDSCKFCQFKY